MERRVIVICSVAGILGLLSASLGFAAEVTKIKVSQVEFTSSTCTYPGSPAMVLGLAAAIALMIAQLIINCFAGCICCRRDRHSDAKWTLALVCFSITWFMFVLAALLLLTGSALNDRHGKESLYLGGYYCYVVKSGVFATGAILSAASVALGIAYFLILCSVKSSPPAPPTGIVMGQPQVPSLGSLDPVFVHEDTYKRRQFG